MLENEEKNEILYWEMIYVRINHSLICSKNSIYNSIILINYKTAIIECTLSIPFNIPNVDDDILIFGGFNSIKNVYLIN